MFLVSAGLTLYELRVQNHVAEWLSVSDLGRACCDSSTIRL